MADLIPCPICHASIRKSRLKNHLRKVHDSLVCVCCGNLVVLTEFSQHLANCDPDLSALRQAVLARGGKIVGKPPNLNGNQWVSRLKSAPDGDLPQRTEFDDLRKDYRIVSGGAYGLGKSRKH